MGTGYKTVVPEDWSDQSKLAEGTAIKIDRLFASTEGATQGQNLVVIRENPAAIKGKKIGELEEQIRKQAVAAVGVPVPEAGPTTKLDGEDARGWTLTNSQGGDAKVQRQLVALHDDVLYTLTVTAGAKQDDGEALLKSIVAGWRWQ